MSETERNLITSERENEGYNAPPSSPPATDNKNTIEDKPATQSDLKAVTAILVGVVVVFFIAFISMTRDNSADRLQTLQEKEQSYQELRSSFYNQTKELYEVRLELQQTRNDLLHALEKKADK